jgi:hypothetical protein
MVLEHLFVGEIMRACWKRSLSRIEMLKSQVDASGYDIVLESGEVIRHIQLKASHVGSHTPQVPIKIELAKKPERMHHLDVLRVPFITPPEEAGY